MTKQKRKPIDTGEMRLGKLYTADYDFTVPSLKQRQAKLTKKFTYEWELN